MTSTLIAISFSSITCAILGYYWGASDAKKVIGDHWQLIKNLSGEIDYSIEMWDQVYFTFKTNPKQSDWHKARVVGINWAFKSVAIEIEGFNGVHVTGVNHIRKNIPKPNFTAP